MRAAHPVLAVVVMLWVSCLPARAMDDAVPGVGAAVFTDAKTYVKYRVVGLSKLMVDDRVYVHLECDGLRALAGVNSEIGGFVALLAQPRGTVEAETAGGSFTAILGGFLPGLEIAVFPDTAPLCRVDALRPSWLVPAEGYTSLFRCHGAFNS